MTPSSQGDTLSSRSRQDSLADVPVGPCASHGAAPGEGAPARLSGSFDTPQGHEVGRYHLDLQKSLEVMRFVIMRENQKLKDIVQQVHEDIAAVRAKVECLPAAGEPIAVPRTEPCCIVWRLRQVDRIL